ncbi:MAG: glycosyltransferase [Anaerolineae bacterium]|nr:glycosyltransferase [Anaerolineae bacterium]
MSDNHSPLHLLILTHAFPYGAAEQFLETEILYAAKQFASITVVPNQTDGQPRLLPDHVTVDLSFVQQRPRLVQRILIAITEALTSRWFYQELWDHPWILHSPRAFRKLLIYHDKAHYVCQWLSGYLRRSTVEPNKLILYTFWFVPQSIGIGLVKQKHPNLKYISRAHRDDLYETDSDPPYIPFRKLTFQALNHLFVISEHGYRYVQETYDAAIRPPMEIARIGINDPGFDNQPSSDGVFRIVSCSFMIPVKRLELFVQGLRIFAQNHPDRLVEWHHIGDGPLHDSISQEAQTQMPSNVNCFFHGHLSNPDVMAFYRDHPVDVFINVSLSEGIPAAIMEAQSTGIPCIATDVGGNPEIVNNTNGVLLPAHPTPQEIAEALLQLASNQTSAAQKRAASKHTWNNHYNASRNYAAFVERIITLFS